MCREEYTSVADSIERKLAQSSVPKAHRLREPVVPCPRTHCPRRLLGGPPSRGLCSSFTSLAARGPPQPLSGDFGDRWVRVPRAQRKQRSPPHGSKVEPPPPRAC